MRSLAEKRKTSDQSTAVSSARSDPPRRSESPERDRAVPATSSGGAGHDFSRIPVFPDAAVTPQPKLAIGTPGDVYEDEADRVAEQVMGMSEPQPASAVPDDGGPRSEREQGHDEPKRVQTKRVQPGSAGEGEPPPIVHEVLAAPGASLDPGTRGTMERRFGHDFSQVRVHTDARAAESANTMDAAAYTAGRNVVFGAGRYAPGTAAGDRLLAHELTHTLQQRESLHTIQRSLKFEFQTWNHVWAVKKSGAPDPRLLPRKYAPTTAGYAEGSGEERGDKPAYLSVGEKGGPARPAGHVAFVEAEGPLVMKEAKSGIDVSKDAQFIKEYRFRTQVDVKDILGKPVGPGKLELARETNNAHVPGGTFNPNTFEFKYVNADGTPLDVHLAEDRRFATGHVKLMKVGRGDRVGIDKAKEAQVIQIWKVTEDPAGDVDFLGRPAKVELVSWVDNAKDPAKRGLFNKNTWQKKYYKAADFSGTALSGSATPLDVHMDTDGRLQSGKVRFMVKEKLTEPKEQTAIELQSENKGVLEFETPKWFRSWPELKERIQEAVDMTKEFNKLLGTSKEVTDPTTLHAIDARKKSDTLGNVVEWPEAFGTAHLKKLHADKRRLLVQIMDKDWWATIQASEGIALSEYGSLVKEHERTWVKDIVIPSADTIFNAAITAAKAKKPTLDESRFADLRGFLQLIVTYIVRGQVLDMSGDISKATFRLMARTNFGSMYKQLLSAEEQALFKTIVGDPKNPILKELEGPINSQRSSFGLGSVSLTRKSPFFWNKVGTHKGKEIFGPAIHDWLLNITKGKDLLSGPGISDAMGAKSVEAKPGDKDYKQAQFEVRGTVAHGGNVHPASRWVPFAKEIFDEAKGRSGDTPDDPTTPKVAENSKTGLKD